MKHNRLTLWLPAVATAILALGVWMGYTISSARPQQKVPATTSLPSQSRSSKVDMALTYIKRAYLDPIDTDTIVENLMHELMSSLDPHSSYIPVEELQAVNEPLEGEFDGIGVVFNMSTDTVVVLNTTAGGPSYKAGVLPGDRIVTVDGDTIAGKKIAQDKVVERLRGRRGTKVRLGLKRDNVEGLVDVDIVRDKIPLHSIDAAFMIRPEVGYIRLTSFARTTHKEFVEAVEKLKKEGMKSLIFDLRSNSGGYLDQAIKMTNEFLPEGQLMVYTEDKYGSQQKEYSVGGGTMTELPLVVLIDDYSASASEIVSGALQDWDRALIVGRPSCGKGLVQRQFGM